MLLNSVLDAGSRRSVCSYERSSACGAGGVLRERGWVADRSRARFPQAPVVRGGGSVRASVCVGGWWCAARGRSRSLRIWGAFAPQAPQQGDKGVPLQPPPKPWRFLGSYKRLVAAGVSLTRLWDGARRCGLRTGGGSRRARVVSYGEGLSDRCAGLVTGQPQVPGVVCRQGGLRRRRADGDAP